MGKKKKSKKAENGESHENIQQHVNGNNNTTIGKIWTVGNLITSNKVIIRHEINPNYDVHISDSQAKRIKDKVDEIASFVPKNKRKEESANIYGLIKDMCRTTSYRLIKQEQFDEVMTYLRKLEVSYERNRPKTDDNAEWRKRKY